MTFGKKELIVKTSIYFLAALDPVLDPRSARAGDLLRRWNWRHALRTALSAGAFGLLLCRVQPSEKRGKRNHHRFGALRQARTKSQETFLRRALRWALRATLLARTSRSLVIGESRSVRSCAGGIHPPNPASP